MPLHSSLGNKSETLSQKKKKVNIAPPIWKTLEIQLAYKEIQLVLVLCSGPFPLFQYKCLYVSPHSIKQQEHDQIMQRGVVGMSG